MVIYDLIQHFKNLKSLLSAGKVNGNSYIIYIL